LSTRTPRDGVVQDAPPSLPETLLTSDSPLPLTASQISLLRKRLLEERDRIQGASVTLAPVRETRERSAEDMDEAEANLRQHEALGRAAHDRTRLAFVERALQKIETGTYGVSELSGEPIGYARLSAVPWTRFSIEEQEQVERQARRYRGL
jgi:DnaK suppressor protein